jgi:hypothetical protein
MTCLQPRIVSHLERQSPLSLGKGFRELPVNLLLWQLLALRREEKAVLFSREGKLSSWTDVLIWGACGVAGKCHPHPAALFH